MLLMKPQFGYQRACSVKGSCARSQLHKLPSQWKHRTASFSPVEKSMESIHYKNHFQQVCIPVGCVPAAHWPYSGRGVCYRGLCLILGGACCGVSATGGVSATNGVSAPRGCLLLGGVCFWGSVYYQEVSATGRCLLLGVSATGGCLLLGVSVSGGCLILGGVYYQGCLLPGGVYYQGCLLLRGVCY